MSDSLREFERSIKPGVCLYHLRDVGFGEQSTGDFTFVPSMSGRPMTYPMVSKCGDDGSPALVCIGMIPGGSFWIYDIDQDRRNAGSCWVLMHGDPKFYEVSFFNHDMMLMHNDLWDLIYRPEIGLNHVCSVDGYDMVALVKHKEMSVVLRVENGALNMGLAFRNEHDMVKYCLIN